MTENIPSATEAAAPRPASAQIPIGVARVVATPAALALIETLKQRHGPALMFYQSHGCCDGSTPMCLKQSEMAMGAADVCMGELGGLPFYAAQAQYEYLQGGQWVIDAKRGSLGTFSLEDSEAMHFAGSQRIWTEAESAGLAKQPLRKG
jgi:uncharacterized protein (DUF779 family)